MIGRVGGTPVEMEEGRFCTFFFPRPVSVICCGVRCVLFNDLERPLTLSK